MKRKLLAIFIAGAMTLSLVSAAQATPTHFSVIEPFVTVSFNQAGNRLEFRVNEGGVPAQTAFAFQGGGVGSGGKVILGDGITIPAPQTPVAENPLFAGAVAYNNCDINEREGLIVGSVAFIGNVPEGTLLFSLNVNGTGRVRVIGEVYLIDDIDTSKVNIGFLDISVSNDFCDDCDVCKGNVIPGHILGKNDATIFDALEVLKDIVGMPNAIDDCESARTASLLTLNSRAKGEPGIFDALEILKHIVGMDSAVPSKR
jgi:hypothetical protein